MVSAGENGPYGFSMAMAAKFKSPVHVCFAGTRLTQPGGLPDGLSSNAIFVRRHQAGIGATGRRKGTAASNNATRRGRRLYHSGPDARSESKLSDWSSIA